MNGEYKSIKGDAYLVNKKVIKRKVDFLKQPIANFLMKENHQRVNRYAKYYEKLSVQKTQFYMRVVMETV